MACDQVDQFAGWDWELGVEAVLDARRQVFRQFLVPVKPDFPFERHDALQCLIQTHAYLWNYYSSYFTNLPPAGDTCKSNCSSSYYTNLAQAGDTFKNADHATKSG